LTCHDDAYESSFSITFFCSPSFPIHQSEWRKFCRKVEKN
jgi:hypothetical protein